MAPPFQPEKFIAANVRAIPRSGIRDFFELVQGIKDVISLGVGEPDFVTPWHIREAAIYALERGKTSYTSNLGLLKLRIAISGYVETKFDVAYDPKKQILVTVGVSEALDIALRAVVNPGDEVLYHEPCYVSYSPSITMAHGVPVPVSCLAENGFALSAEAIEKAVTPRAKVVVLNFPTNPTGGTMTRAEWLKIADVLLRHNLLVITDEIYAELTFEGEHVSIASLPGMRERTIFLHGFSKAYAMTGFRIGYACGPTELIEAMMRIQQYSMLCARSEEHTSELQSPCNLVCRLLLEKKKRSHEHTRLARRARFRVEQTSTRQRRLRFLPTAGVGCQGDGEWTAQRRRLDHTRGGRRTR